MKTYIVKLAPREHARVCRLMQRGFESVENEFLDSSEKEEFRNAKEKIENAKYIRHGKAVRVEPKTSQHRNISRVQKGYVKHVRMTVVRSGIQFVKTFLFSTFGSWEAAEQAAVAERDRVITMTAGKSAQELLSLRNEYCGK